MFTGIIDHCGTIKEIITCNNGITIIIACEFDNLVEGESIAIDGTCLTVVSPKNDEFSCDISPETLQITTAGNFQTGQKINLERALRIGDRLGGHWVTGHVDQTARVKKIITHNEYTELHITNIAAEMMVYLSKKGSITINGVSLTINQIQGNSFQVMLIPHTLQRTNLNLLLENSTVNLEFDWLAKVVANQLKQLVIPAK